VAQAIWPDADKDVSLKIFWPSSAAALRITGGGEAVAGITGELLPPPQPDTSSKPNRAERVAFSRRRCRAMDDRQGVLDDMKIGRVTTLIGLDFSPMRMILI
jgi:hypothetical protein